MRRVGCLLSLHPMSMYRRLTFDPGQVSGFITMDDFKIRFGQHNPVTDTYYFSNVRSGLIVGLVCF